MHLRLYFQILGGHVHCRLFVGKSKATTHGKSGDLLFNLEEWPEVKEAFTRIAEVMEEGDG